jgi:hypothetical protein
MRRAGSVGSNDVTGRGGCLGEIEGRTENMPLFMDVHHMDGAVSCADVRNAHAADLKVQGEHDVRYLSYWVDEGHGKIFCLVDAPSAELAAEVHRKAHGLVADEIYPVVEGD